MSDNPIKLDRVSVQFGPVQVFADLSLTIARGEFVAVVGPSGCGKTTILNLLSAFTTPSSGTLECLGEVRMVYQHDGLFPWLTVSENILLGLREVKGDAERKAQLKTMLELIRLANFADHYPHQLSGGMKQRVELARALAGNSDILLLDEPFSALDYLTRLRIRGELVRMLTERPRTVVLVTHDIEEAAQLADRVVVLSDRPATIHREVVLTSPRPRELTEPEVVSTTHEILRELGL